MFSPLFLGGQGISPVSVALHSGSLLSSSAQPALLIVEPEEVLNVNITQEIFLLAAGQDRDFIGTRRTIPMEINNGGVAVVAAMKHSILRQWRRQPETTEKFFNSEKRRVQ
ncbi:hypothetical protein HAX54_050896 [Datura stramonium]|uniref:Uncharacterized protein n=1 Tax=Datura stramonium TaxID=4076 RepID=A0ABS8SXW5_DATST|nr:hypothetical protein [Datura stramonium]